jgi:hypothetical protein
MKRRIIFLVIVTGFSQPDISFSVSAKHKSAKKCMPCVPIVQQLTMAQLLISLVFPWDDAAKLLLSNGVDYAVPLSGNTFVDTYARHYGIEYGTQAVWAGAYYGVDAIPAQLIRYAVLDCIACQVNRALPDWYPPIINNRGITARLIFSTARNLCIKRCIGCFLDYLVNVYCSEEDNNSFSDQEL